MRAILEVRGNLESAACREKGGKVSKDKTTDLREPDLLGAKYQMI